MGYSGFRSTVEKPPRNQRQRVTVQACLNCYGREQYVTVIR